MEDGKIKEFESLNVTTMTLIMTLSGATRKDVAFHLFPVVKMKIDPNVKITSKSKLPHCKIPGSIISMRFGPLVRGIIKKGKPFKNAVTIDISTKIKNISMKLSSNTIQMCGASSEADGLEAGNYIVQYLNEVQENLDMIQADMEHAKKCLEYVSLHTKGAPVEREITRHIIAGNVKMNVLDNIIDHEVVNLKGDIPPEYNERLVRFFARFTKEYNYHSLMMTKLIYILSVKNVIEPSEQPLEIVSIDGHSLRNENYPVSIGNTDLAMVNYNYKLGFLVNRSSLARHIDGLSGFTYRYKNALLPAVTIELPYEPVKKPDNGRRKLKVPHHTFLVYRSGAVTQSGPGGEIMRDAYYLFMSLICKIKDAIIYDPTGNTPINEYEIGDATPISDYCDSPSQSSDSEVDEPGYSGDIAMVEY